MPKKGILRHLTTAYTLHRSFLAHVLMLIQSYKCLTIITFTISQEFPLEELFTHAVPLADINQAFELLKQPNCVEVVINI